MKLVGRYLSPFVRRVATTLNLYGMEYEHVPLMTQGDDRSTIEGFNPLTRVPALVLDDGETLVDSAAILDYLDHEAGSERSLTPLSGAPRRHVLKLMAVATGAAEKAVLTVYEKRFRPEEKWHTPWTDMCGGQARGGLRWLDQQIAGPWFGGEQMSQADVSATCCVGFIRAANPGLLDGLDCRALLDLCERAEALPAFTATAPA